MDGHRELADRYIAAWNETDAGRRRALVARTWTEDGRYCDPKLGGEGHDGIAGMIGAAQEHFPGHLFRRTSPVDAHNDRLRLTWELASEGGGAAVFSGTDFAVVAADGRLRSVTGFFDAPAPAAG
jgi:hypothetical protein